MEVLGTKRVIILEVGDWEALYLDGQLVGQGHTIEESDYLYYLKLAEKQQLTSNDFERIWVDDIPEIVELLEVDGSFDNDLERYLKAVRRNQKED